MDLKEIMSVSGMPGLYKVMANRTDGLIVEGLHDKARKFVSSRQHMFTPLENITLYTTEDSIELKFVLSNMKKNEGAHPVPDIKKTDDSALRNYMKVIVPNYDEEKVYASDIKKLIKWYDLLNANQLVSVIEEGAEESASEDQKEINAAETYDETSAEDSVAEKPKKATKTKKAEATEDTEEKPKKKPSKKAE